MCMSISRNAHTRAPLHCQAESFHPANASWWMPRKKLMWRKITGRINILPFSAAATLCIEPLFKQFIARHLPESCHSKFIHMHAIRNPINIRLIHMRDNFRHTEYRANGNSKYACAYKFIRIMQFAFFPCSIYFCFWFWFLLILRTQKQSTCIGWASDIALGRPATADVFCSSRLKTRYPRSQNTRLWASET